jgi:DNA-binding NtrC family response regulator
VVAEAVDAVTSFVTASDASSQAFKTATLLKTLSINALISGEVGVGKKSLARYILPDASLVDASNFNELLIMLKTTDSIIITNLDKSPNIGVILDNIKKVDVRIIATSTVELSDYDIDEIFTLKFDIPSLSQRKEDVHLLIEQFATEASLLFGVNESFNAKNLTPDLSKNAITLKRQVMFTYLMQDIQESELMDIIQNYLHDKLGSNSDYRNYLHLYEAPLINAGLARFKSQLQLSDKLGLNRNTLRKKIAENKKYIKGK